MSSQVWVIKFGSDAVWDGEKARESTFAQLPALVEEIEGLGHRVIIVCSGAIAFGKAHFSRLDSRDDVRYSQALAAVGQPLLMQAMSQAFEKNGRHCAQVLLTHDDIRGRKRFLNARNTLLALLDRGIIPIVNENDSISYDEITVGDNDQLSVMVAQMSFASKVVLFTKAQGLLHENAVVPSVDYKENLGHIRYFSSTQSGRGGIAAKLEAVKKCTQVGLTVELGSYQSTLIDVCKGKSGTTFFPSDVNVCPREAKLVASARTGRSISVDAGAAKALAKGKSLLPAGVVRVNGEFNRGDTLQIRSERKLIGHGVVEFDSTVCRAIKGRHSSELPPGPKVVIHRNNMVLKDL